MWRTPDGERVLEGANAEAFRAALREFVLDLERADPAPLQGGLGAFDQLTLAAKLAILERVAAGLLREDVEPPELNAVTESGAAAVYRYLLQLLQREVEESPTSAVWRTRVAVALRETGFGTPPHVSSTDGSHWASSVAELMEQVFWDSDYASDFGLPDLSPETSSSWREVFGIDDGYYGAIAPDPSDAELAEIRKRLELLWETPN